MFFIDLTNRSFNRSQGAVTASLLGIGVLLGSMSWCHSVIALESDLLRPSETTQLSQPYIHSFSKNGDRSDPLIPLIPLMIAQTVHSEPTQQEFEQQQEFERQQEIEQQEIEQQEIEQQEIEQQVLRELADFTTSSDASDVIVLGQPDNFPYVIVIPGDNREVLQAVQGIIPTAFITSSRRGRYIYATSFAKRRPADALSAQLRYLRFDSQVHYMPTD